MTLLICKHRASTCSTINIDFNIDNDRKRRPKKTPPPQQHHFRHAWQPHYHHDHLYREHKQPPRAGVENAHRRAREGQVGEKAGGWGWGLRRDSSRAPGAFFSLFFELLLIDLFFLQLGLPDNNYYHHLWRPQRRYRAQNDAICVVWALGEFFFIHQILYTY